MGSLNSVTIIGNLGRDAELRYTPGGNAVASFSVATTSAWKDQAGVKKEQTEWHRIVLWGKTAEALTEYLRKGKQVCVQGRLQTRKWTDKEKIERQTTEIVAHNVVLLGSRNDGAQQAAPAVSSSFGQPAAQGFAEGGDDPFGMPAGDDVQAF